MGLPVLSGGKGTRIRIRRDADGSPKNQGYHYNRNAETYMEVGDALGRAMAELLNKQDK